jgi:hypothetical protein
VTPTQQKNHMKINPWKKLTVLTFACCATSPLMAATIFSDDFTGVGNPNAAGYYSYNTNSGGTAWTIAADNTSPLSGNTLRNAGGSAGNTIVYKQVTAFTLAADGDYADIALDFHSVGTGGLLGVQLVSSMSSFSANNFGGANPLIGTTGYLFQQNFNAATPTYRESSGTTVTLLNSPTGGSTISNTAQSFTFRLTRVAGGLQMDASFNGVPLSSYTDTTVSSYTFNTVGLSSGTAINYDNIALNVVPEPASISLLAMGAVGGLVLIRLRRRTA